MPIGFSTYLDLLRLAAALIVFFDHWGRPEFAGPGHGGLASLGHSAVIVFFVLSGYLITAVASEKETGAGAFLASRAARIYSVALPALALTACVDLILLARGHTDGIPLYQYAAPAKYLVLFLGFGTDLWFVRENAFSNLPYWSLSYEVWYYALFAAAHYARGRSRVLLIVAVLALVGPRLWLLLPAWALGGAAYRLQRYVAPSRTRARLGFAAALIALIAAKALRLDDALNAWTGAAIAALAGPDALPTLRYSRDFAGDWLFAGLLAAHLLAARFAGLELGAVGPAIRAAAGFTFTLYLMHYPLLELFAGLFAPSPPVLAGLVAGAVWLLGLLTERQKPHLRRMIVCGIDRVRALMPLPVRDRRA